VQLFSLKTRLRILAAPALLAAIIQCAETEPFVIDDFESVNSVRSTALGFKSWNGKMEIEQGLIFVRPVRIADQRTTMPKFAYTASEFCVGIKVEYRTDGQVSYEVNPAGFIKMPLEVNELFLDLSTTHTNFGIGAMFGIVTPGKTDMEFFQISFVEYQSENEYGYTKGFSEWKTLGLSIQDVVNAMAKREGFTGKKDVYFTGLRFDVFGNKKVRKKFSYIDNLWGR